MTRLRSGISQDHQCKNDRQFLQDRTNCSSKFTIAVRTAPNKTFVISVRSFPFFICSLFIWMITVLNSFFYDVHNRPKWKSVLANDSSFFMNLQSERIPKRLTVSVNWMSIQGATNSTTHMMTHHNDQLLVIDQSEVIILKFRENSTFL